jgi:hypothetical protein
MANAAFRWLAGAGLALTLAGCTMTFTERTNDRHTMSGPDSDYYFAAVPDARMDPQYPAYEPFQCNFSTSWRRKGLTNASQFVTLNLRPVRDRMLATMRAGTVNSTALISSDGRMHSYNFVDFQTGQRVTGENLPPWPVNAATPYQLRPEGAWLNPFSLLFPQFRQGPMAAGGGQAVVLGSDRLPAALYEIRGAIDYQGRPALMFTLYARPEGKNKVTIGYGMFDRRTGLPLLVYVDTRDYGVRIALSACGR